MFVKIIDRDHPLFDCVGEIKRGQVIYEGCTIVINVDGSEHTVYIDQVQIWEGD